MCSCDCTSTEHYHELLVNFILLLGFDEHGVWFPQGGATVHIAKKKSCPRSLFILLFFKVYKKTLHTLEELKQDVLLHISSVTEETLQWVA